MRIKRLGILSAVLALATFGCAKAKKQLIEVDGLPSTVHQVDFGSISVGTRAVHTIDFVDDGRAPVQIASITTLGGQPVFSAQATARVVKGIGGKAHIDITFHPESEGQFGDELVIRTSSDETPELHVQLKGVGGPAALQFVPPLLDWGGVELGDQRTIGFDVINPTDLPLAISSDSAAGEFDLSGLQAAPNSTTHLTATFHSGTVGHRQLHVTATPCANCTAIQLPGQAEALKSAIAVEPDPVVWDGIPVHHTATKSAMLHNRSWRDVKVDHLTVNGEDFKILAGPLGATIPAGQAQQVTLQFVPQHLGPTDRLLQVGYQSFAARTGEGKLQGLGGGPQIAVNPTSLQFDDLPVGGKQRLPIYVQNAGQFKALTITGLSGLTPPFSVTMPANPNVDPGATAMQLPVDFAPTTQGNFSGELHIQSNDPATPEVVIPVSGSAHPAGPCSFELTPDSLDFGNVPPGAGAVLGFRFQDTGTTECAVKDIQLTDDSDPDFFMPGGSLVGGDLHPTDAFSAQVAFKSPHAGEFHATLTITVNDPQRPTATIPIVAHSAESCLTAAPPYIDFGAVRMDCSPRDGSTIVSNACAAPVTVTGVEIGSATLPEFSLIDPPATPSTYQAGQSFQVTARYARSSLGQQYGALYVKADNEPYPLLVPLLAETLHEGQQFDRFVQGSANQADVLFVVSNTNTMQSYQQRLANAVGGLLTAAQSQGVDLHVGVTSAGLSAVNQAGCYGGASGGEAGRLIPVDGSAPRVVTLNTANAETVLRQSLQAGTCQNLEQGLEAMRLALSPPLVDHLDDPRTSQPNDGNAGFSRDSARLSVVVLSDEDDHSGYDPTVYSQFLRSLKGLDGASRSALYAIVPKSGSCATAGNTNDRFAAVVQATGGDLYDVCENDFSGLIAELTQRGIGQQTMFPLSSVPDGSGITVKLDGQVASGGDWYYYPQGNDIVFNPGHVPAPGTTIEVDYTSACP